MLMGWISVLVFSFTVFRPRDVNLGCYNVLCGGDLLVLLQQPLFVYYSNLVRLVIFKWNRHSIYSFSTALEFFIVHQPRV